MSQEVDLPQWGMLLPHIMSVSECTLFKQLWMNLHVFMWMHLHHLCPHECVWTLDPCLDVCACLCMRPGSKAPHLETALERRVIDKYWPLGFFQPNYHHIGSSRQTVYTPVCLFLFLSCTHRSMHTNTHQMCIPTTAAWTCTADVHTWYIALQSQLNTALSQ